MAPSSWALRIFLAVGFVVLPAYSTYIAAPLDSPGGGMALPLAAKLRHRPDKAFEQAEHGVYVDHILDVFQVDSSACTPRNAKLTADFNQMSANITVLQGTSDDAGDSCTWTVSKSDGSTLKISFWTMDLAEGDSLMIQGLPGDGTLSSLLHLNGPTDKVPASVESKEPLKIVFTASNWTNKRSVSFAYWEALDSVSGALLFNSTLILLGLVWCGVTFARLVCVHRARERGHAGGFNNTQMLSGRGAILAGDAVGLGAATSLRNGLTQSQINALEMTTSLPRKFGVGGVERECFTAARHSVDPCVDDVEAGYGSKSEKDVNPGKHDVMGDEEATCAICLCEEEEGQSLRVLPCGHFFHASCVDVWLGQSSSCPFCKRSVDPPVEEIKPPSTRQPSVNGGRSSPQSCLRMILSRLCRRRNATVGDESSRNVARAGAVTQSLPQRTSPHSAQPAPYSGLQSEALGNDVVAEIPGTAAQMSTSVAESEDNLALAGAETGRDALDGVFVVEVGDAASAEAGESNVCGTDGANNVSDGLEGVGDGDAVSEEGSGTGGIRSAQGAVGPASSDHTCSEPVEGTTDTSDALR